MSCSRESPVDGETVLVMTAPRAGRCNKCRQRRRRLTVPRGNPGMLERAPGGLRGYGPKAAASARSWLLRFPDRDLPSRFPAFATHQIWTRAPLPEPRGHWCRQNRMSLPQPGPDPTPTATDPARSARATGAGRKEYGDWAPEVQARRDLAMLERQRHLDQAGDAGRGLEMADIGFDRAQCARAPGGRSTASTAPRALASIGSPSRVPVPCASTY